METQRYTTFPIPVTRSVLDDGLTVWTAERPSKLVTVQIVLSIGSLDDGVHPGTAHFLEHVLYEGPARDGVHPALRSLIVNGINGSAGTSSSYTEYWCAGLAENFHDMLAALNEIVFNGGVCPDEVDRERAVILQEMHKYTRQNRYDCWFSQVLFPDVPAMHHPTIGTPESVAAMDADILRSFWSRWYHPNRAAVIVVGGITHAQVLEAIARITKPSSADDSPPRRPLLVPTFTRATYTELDAATCVEIYFPSPEDRRERILFEFATNILTDYPFGILTQRLRHEQRVAYGVSVERLAWPIFSETISVNVPQKHFARVEEEIHSGIDRLVRCEYPMDAYDVVRAKERISLASRVEERNAWWVNYFYSNWIGGQLEDIDTSALVLNATREDIAAVAAKYLTRERYGVIRVVPPDDAAPENR